MSDPAAPARPPRITRCAHCGLSTRLDAANRWRPFCSERCKVLDLGGWFGERYAIPADDQSPESGSSGQ